MTSQILPLIVFQTAALIGAAGQFFYKRGTSSSDAGPVAARLQLLSGMGLYIGVTILFFLAYRLGGEVSVLYPTYGATFVWALLIARFFSKERITTTKVIGTAFVIGGICLVTI